MVPSSTLYNSHKYNYFFKLHQDNDPKHTSSLCTSYLTENDVFDAFLEFEKTLTPKKKRIFITIKTQLKIKLTIEVHDQIICLIYNYNYQVFFLRKVLLGHIRTPKKHQTHHFLYTSLISVTMTRDDCNSESG
ncbi:hypothetical protein BpHYR1_001002 [Brachionus plicatilis]|uniref:Uncharacterized protein n=1 Tax=Brachionus plicatilis TaxID=10195 RepID=A0A3M7PC68_BRAPC|nr:hypothetical protein BpHYR1_001002 [Brachionus plicatilis]